MQFFHLCVIHISKIGTGGNLAEFIRHYFIYPKLMMSNILLQVIDLQAAEMTFFEEQMDNKLSDRQRNTDVWQK
jgi:hypothetical protein